MAGSVKVRVQRFAVIVLVVSLCFAGDELAAIQCYQCHGSKTPPDYRPVDASYRNITTGAFQGNHRTHMDASATKESCAKCHPDSVAYLSGHRNGLIELSPTINSSPLAAVYRNGSTAFPQRPVPRLGSCNNVNCHFERETPVWGTTPLAVPAGCSVCHGSPPDGGDTGAAGSHHRHGLYFPGPGGCAHCHANHLVDGNTFAHATSAGRRNLDIRLISYSSPGGSYSGPLDDFLPKSQENRFGSCGNIYCHSNGTGSVSFSSNVMPTWGTALPEDCSGCHGGDYRSATEIATGSHTIHVGRDMYGQYIYDCSTCHSATATDSRTIGNMGNHVNKIVDVVLKPNFGGTYSATGHAPGGAVGSCQNVYCHSNVQPNGGVGGPTAYDNPTWGDANSVNCGDCHVGDGGHGHGGAKMATGSHTRHLDYAFTTTSSTVKCMICHKYTDQPFVTSCFGNPYGNTVCHWGAGAKHANGQVDVRLDPTFGNMSAYQGAPQPGNGYANCLNTYCHSNGSSISTGQIPPSSTTTWGSGTLACNACHGNPPDYVNGAPKANSHANHSNFSCSRCHYGTTSTGTTITSITLHVNKALDVSGPPETPFTYLFSTSGGTCSANSCHNDGTSVSTGIVVNRDASWGSSPGCAVCHGYPPAYASGSPKQNSHAGHGVGCGYCHAGTTSDGVTITDRTKHANGAYDLQPGPGISFAYQFNATTGGSCSSANCHFETATSAWGTDSSITVCTTCHGAPPDGMSPTYSGGDAGSHSIHNAYYGGTSNCVKCHSDHTADPSPFAHATSIHFRSIAVQPRTPFNVPYGTYSGATGGYLPSQAATHTFGTCRNTYCHSTVQADGGVGLPTYGAPTWGASLSSCNSTCHNVGGHGSASTIATGSHTRHLAYYFGLSGEPSAAARCTICHHWPSDPTSSAMACIGCHTPHSPIPGPLLLPGVLAKHVNGMIDIAFNTSVTTGAYNGIDSPMSKLPGSGYSACTNTYCHSSGVSVATGTIPANSSPAWGSGAMPCTGCHDYPPAYANGSPKANSHQIHSAYGCNICHANTTSDGVTVTNTQYHVNKAYDVNAGGGVSFTYTYYATGGTCADISCHSGSSATWGQP